MNNVINGFINVERPYLVLIVVEPTKISKFKVDTVKSLLGREGNGLYIIVDNLYRKISELLESSGIDTNKLFFIDTMTKTASNRAERTENCLFTNSPRNLTEICYAITQIVQVKPETNFMFFDSLPTLFYYNESESVIKFLHFLSSATKALNMIGVFIIIKGENEKIIKLIESFFDKVIEIK